MSYKRIVSLIAALLLLILLAACKGSEGGNAANSPVPSGAWTEKPTAAPETQAPTAAPTPEPNMAFHSVSLNDNSAAYSQEVRYGGIEELREQYERAAEIGSRHGIYIYIADLVPNWILAHGNETQCDPALVKRSLDQVERILGYYPEGYFDQLLFDEFYGLDLYLVAYSSVAMGSTSFGPEVDPVGGTDMSRMRHFVCIDCEDLLIDTLSNTLPHELAHVTDRRLQYVSEHEEGRLFSEEAWNALNPEGFVYPYDDEELTNEIIEQHVEYLEYFSNSYAMQNPLEDRANLMGYLSRAAMGDSELDPDRYFEPCLIKTEFYLRCLRDAFDTSSWPEKTVWEQALEVLMGGGN